MEALSDLLLLIWMIVTLSLLLSFIGPIRRSVLRRHQIRLSRARWALGLSAITLFVAIGITAPPPQKQVTTPSASLTSAAALKESKFELVGLTYLNSYPGVCKTPELVVQFNTAWKAVSDPVSAKLMMQVSKTYYPHLALTRCPTCNLLVQQGECIVTHPGSSLDSDQLPRAKVAVIRAQKGRAKVRLIATNQTLWTTTENIAFNEAVALEKLGTGQKIPTPP